MTTGLHREFTSQMKVKRQERNRATCTAFGLRLAATVELYSESWSTMRGGRYVDLVFGLRMLGLQAVAVDVKSSALREVA